MRKTLLLIAYTFFYLAVTAQQKLVSKEPQVITGKLVKITKRLKDFKEADNIKFVKVRDKDGLIGMDDEEKERKATRKKQIQNQPKEDPALQKKYGKTAPVSANRAIVQNFDGMSDVGASPADPTLCVGPNHIVQMVNGASGALMQVFDKAGNILLPAKSLDAITGNGGLGDGIALYDQLADRFILTEIVNKGEVGTEGLSVAVSQTPDPTGAWFVYFFNTGINFPDYPKFSVWNDAYYATSHDFANRTQVIGCSMYAFDRAKMLVGDPTATMQKFLIGSAGAERELSMCPVLLQGSTLPPAGTGGLIAYMNDNNWSGSLTDSIGLLEFKVNFSNPALSSLNYKSSLAVSPYIPFVGFTGGFSATQPGSTLNLDVVQQRIMNQPIYRNFGDHEGIVLTHVVDQGAQVAGVRWYELQKTTGNWNLKNHSTFGPDNTFRCIPSIAYDAAGNIGLAYNVSSAVNNVFPGARYTGRSSCDAANTMTLAENDLAIGTAANGGNRWGDYNHLVCDPDGVRFWFTCSYNTTFLWTTRISSFTLDNCAAALCGDPTNLASANVTGSSATVSWTAVPNAINYDIDLQLDGTGSWTRMATALGATSFDFTGLGSNLTWNWRVRANCAAGAGNFVTASFTTVVPCSEPTDLFSFDETSTSASVSWIPGISFNSFDLEYKLSTSLTWISAGNTTTTFVNINGLAANSVYDWRVRAVCTNGNSTFVAAQFSTTAAQSCPSIYDNAPNNNFKNAQSIPLNIDIKGMINPREDEDFYKFTLPARDRVSISLTMLPKNYDIKLYNQNRSQIAASEKRGTANETINRTLSPGTYFIKVYGKDQARSNTQCYNLNAAINSGLASASINEPELSAKSQIKIFPNPAEKTLNVMITGMLNVEANISVFNAEGKLLITQQAKLSNTILDISRLAKGVYFIRIDDADATTIYKSSFIKQ